MSARDKDGSPVTIVTFNRMLRRLLDLILQHEAEDDGSDLKALTMHRLVWQHYRQRTGSNPPNVPPDQYARNWEAMSKKLHELARASPDEEHLVVDEGQDLPEGFFGYAARHVSKVMTVFADENQALGDRRTTLEQIKRAARLSDPIILTQNHRNTPEIARLAEHFHGGRLPAATVLRSSLGQFPRLVLSRNLKSTADLVSNWYKTRGGSVGVIVNRNPIGSDLWYKLSCTLPDDTRVDMYDSADPNDAEIDLLEPGVTILNKESVKGQEFDAVFVLELDRFLPCRTEAERRAMYMMCTRAKDNLLLVYGPADLSPAIEGALPGPDILERS